MVVCKYFQQGNCRFGQDCRFEHIYGSRYSYHANPPQSSQSGITDEQLINQVQSDIQSALKGGQWILSAYAPFKKPAFPGMTELSPEETRLFIYEAKANNNVDQAVEYINNLFKQARLNHEMLLHPTPALVKVFRSLYNGESVPVPSPFGNSTPRTNSATSIFRSAVQNTSGFGQNTNTRSSIFGQQPSNNGFETQNEMAQSIFAQANQNVFGPSQPNIFAPNQTTNANVFGPQASNNAEAKSIFAQANQNIFSPNQMEAKSIFAQANQNFVPSQTQSNASSVFANASKNAFGASDGFAQTNQSFLNQSNVFQISEPKNVFGVANNAFEQQTDVGVYSKMDELSPDDLKAYESNDFELGFVPEIPPPQVLCF